MLPRQSDLLSVCIKPSSSAASLSLFPRFLDLSLPRCTDIVLTTMVLEHHRLRYKPPRSSPNCDSTTFSMHTLPRRPSPAAKDDVVKDEKQLAVVGTSKPKLRFVRVEDSLFKVPESFFQNMPQEIQDHTKYTTGVGKTPEKPILLVGHTNHQFRQFLEAYNSYPSLNPRSMDVDTIFTIGELAYMYQQRHLALWFMPIFKDVVISAESPLHHASNNIFVRAMKLGIAYGSRELCHRVSTRWIARMHRRELDPLSALLFADTYNLRDLLSHAYYIYLMLVFRRIQQSHDIDPRGLLTPGQRTHVMSGYHSLSAYWNHLRLNPPEFEAAPSCTSHLQCLGAWRLQWIAAAEKDYPLPELDILGRLTYIEKCLREEMVLDVVLNRVCKASALKAVSVKREMVARQLHHHFDL
ncbi:hypothetical protein JR316_0007285 [Psilocybe cubensis]|uniref:Uncharacterized protein n=2 Tax=Psilocybe cubensis TaxID=181762 RepID=A0ACB8GY58_PSICU|nr:hypothetical protein JR316_0007285 [Psilocybe cubensis]KAH9480685.1 hypothetical protein JR316_0007285 [Psilocybe cubensis]